MSPGQSILDYTPHPEVIAAGVYQAFKTPTPEYGM